MNVQFLNARNGDLTASYNNLFLHSNYNPQKEAERFVESINCTYTPPLIIITEPCISYIIPLLKNKFPSSKIAVIRYVNDFNKFNNEIDFVFNYFTLASQLENEMISQLGEENIINSLLLQWQPSSKAFENIEKDVLNIVKDIFEKSKTLLVTREYFEKKWFINSINFVKYLNKQVKFNNKINVPVVIISSGPSLKPALDIIKNNKNKLFIICLSSAIKVCLSNDIIPDLCISTDGGFWAGEHLKSLKKNNIPLAAPLEAYIPKSILNNNKIIPLKYNDGLSYKIAELSNVDFDYCQRNGTVSGTALLYALDNSEHDIYFCGLDLANQRGFQHCQPNELEINNSLGDCKLKSSEYRNSRSEYSKGVLSVYEDWFAHLDLGKRHVYRVIDQGYRKNKLGQIKDISKEDFYFNLSNEKESKSLNYFTEINCKKDYKKVIDFINKNENNYDFIKSLFPLSCSTLLRNKDNNDIEKRINKEKLRLIKKIRLILNDK